MKKHWLNISTRLRIWLVEPGPSVQATHQNPRTARLLAGLLLVFSASAILRLIYTLIWGKDLGASFFILVVCSLAYWLSRTRHYPLAAGMAAFLLALPSFINVLNGPSFNETEIRSHLNWLILPLVFGSIFLSIPGMVVMAVVILTGIIYLPLVNPAIHFNSVYGSLGLLGTSASFLLVMLRHHQRLENDRQKVIKQREDRYRALFERTNDAVFIFNMKGVLQEVNRQGAALLGYEVEEMAGMTTPELVSPHEILDNKAKKLALLRGETLPIYERTFCHRAGHPIPAEVSVAVVYDDSGQPLHIQSIVRDIRERKRAEHDREQLINQLETQNTELERFTYTVSHDLRSPLVTIRGFLGYLEKDLAAGKTDQVQHDIARIHNAIEKMRHLLDDLLMLSRAGRQMSTPDIVSIEEIAQGAVELLQGRLDERKVRVVIADDLPTAWGDSSRLIQVMQNLLDNAIKFMGDQQQAQISISSLPSEDNDLVHLCVKDNGRGIALEDQHKIFGLFEKLDSQSEGSGIGLALVQRIVEAHGGQIWVESPGANQGTAFHFTLPRPPATRQPHFENGKHG